MWLNFYDYKRQRENEAIMQRIHAKGKIENELEEAVYQEMAKAKVQLDPGTEAEGEAVKVPISIDFDDIHFLSQFSLLDWTAAYAYRYNDWLAHVAKIKKEAEAESKLSGEAKLQEVKAKLDQIPKWAFMPTPRAGRVYFVYMGGAHPFYKLDAEASDEHFATATGTPEERKAYQSPEGKSGYLNWPKGGMYGYDLSDPIPHEKGQKEFDYNKDEEGEEESDTLEPGEVQFSFGSKTQGTCEGMTRKRAAYLLQNFLRRNAEGWNTFSQPWSGQNVSSDTEKQGFLALPRHEIPKPGKKAKGDTNVVPMLTASIIENKFNNSPIGNAARMQALESMDEKVLNEYGLTKNKWMCVDCMKSFNEGGICPHCKKDNIKKNALHEHISVMQYGATEENGVGARIIPCIVKKKITRIVSMIPYMKPQRMVQLRDWERFEPKTLQFYKPQNIDGKPVQIEPLSQKIKALRLGMIEPEQFFKDVMQTSVGDATYKVEEIENETQKKGDRRQFVKKLGDELAGIWMRLELQRLARKNNARTDEEFQKITEAYLKELTHNTYELASTIKTGDIYDANIRQRQMGDPEKRPNTFRWYGGMNGGYQPMHNQQERRNASQDIVDRWNTHLVNLFGQSAEAGNLFAVSPYPFEKDAVELAHIESELAKLEKTQSDLMTKRDKLPRGSQEYNKLEMKIKKNRDEITDLRLRRDGKIALSPIAKGIQNYITSLKAKGGINQLKGETLEAGFTWVMRGSLARVKRKLGVHEFKAFLTAEKEFEQVRDNAQENDEQKVVGAFQKLKASLDNLRKFLSIEGKRYATLMWQLNLVGEGTRKQIARSGDMTHSADKSANAGSEEQGLIDIISAAVERRHTSQRDEYEDEEDGGEDTLSANVPMKQSVQARRLAAVAAASTEPEHELQRAKSAYGLDWLDLTVATNLVRIKISLEKKRAMLVHKGLSDDQVEEEMEKFVQHVKQRQNAEREAAEAQEREEGETVSRQEKEDKVYRVGNAKMTPQQIVDTLRAQYQQAVAAFQANPANPSIAAKEFEKLNQSVDSTLSDPHIRTQGISLKKEYENISTQAIALAHLLDPDILMDVSSPGKGRHAVEDVVRNKRADGSGIYMGFAVNPQLMATVQAALNRISRVKTAIDLARQQKGKKTA